MISKVMSEVVDNQPELQSAGCFMNHKETQLGIWAQLKLSCINDRGIPDYSEGSRQGIQRALH